MNRTERRYPLRTAFTLIELLVVIAIIAILSVVVILTLNPAELLKQSRDSNRISDLTSINTALNVFSTDQPSGSLGTASTTYVSIPDSSVTCANLGLPTLPSGWAYRCVSSSTLRNVNGTGWLPVDLTSISAGAPVSQLPVDPVNSTSTGLYYTYTPGGSYELAAAMEAVKNKMGQAQDKTSSDGGSYPDLYEVGTNLGLLPVDRGDSDLVGYWRFDDAAGSTPMDSSGSGNVATTVGSPSWTGGKVKGGLQIGTGNGVSVADSSALDISDSFTISAWVNITSSASQYQTVLVKGANGRDYTMLLNAPAMNNVWAQIAPATSYSNSVTVSPAIPLNQWTQIAITVDNTAKIRKAYVNGSQQTSQSGTGSPSPNNETLDIGTGSVAAGTTALQGSIDEVRIYKRALSATEILALYSGTR